MKRSEQAFTCHQKGFSCAQSVAAWKYWRQFYGKIMWITD